MDLAASAGLILEPALAMGEWGEGWLKREWSQHEDPIINMLITQTPKMDEAAFFYAA